ncbi:MAG: hypothetical protein K1X75_14485 [Leptospirales bacterium]|nr:hypothetical protein [Leptospirales bacterium]
MDAPLEHWRRVSSLGGALHRLTERTAEELALNRARRDAWREYSHRWRRQWLDDESLRLLAPIAAAPGDTGRVA